MSLLTRQLSRQILETEAALEEQRQVARATRAAIEEIREQVSALSGIVTEMQGEVEEARAASAQLEYRVMEMLDRFRRDH